MGNNIMEDEERFDNTLAGFPMREAESLSKTRLGIGADPPDFEGFDYDDMPDDEDLVRFVPVQDALVKLSKGEGCYYFEIRSKRSGQCLMRIGLTSEQAADMFTGGSVNAIAQFFGPEGE